MTPDAATAGGASASGGFVVPPEIEQKFGSLITLLRGSESMNDEERNYWVSILPAMTPEQITNLQQILENEKRQLAEIDAKYAAAVEGAPEVRDVKVIDAEKKQKREARKAAEEEHSKNEEGNSDDILKQIESA